jgi:hypothetical protein
MEHGENPLTEPALGNTEESFSLVAGGPFHAILRHIGWIGEDLLPTRGAAVGLALIAWLPPVVLALAQSLVDGRTPDWSILSDATVHTRYLAAIWVMVATERYADSRFILLARHFRGAGLLSAEARSAFATALACADRRSGSALAEGLAVAAALVWSSLAESYVVVHAGSSWEGSVVGGRVVLSWAGHAARFLSNPLFLFLVLRWAWRFGVWTVLLFRISRLPLQLAPLHPDRTAGLGFLAIYPSIFNGFVVALSAVIASAMLKELGLVEHSTQTISFAFAGWIAINLVVFVGPLLVFARPLYHVRERALLEYGRAASQHHLAIHRRWIEAGRSGEDLMGSDDPSSVADLNESVQAVLRMRIVPVDGAALLQIVVAAGLPLLAVVATQVPLTDLVRWIVGAIL